MRTYCYIHNGACAAWCMFSAWHGAMGTISVTASVWLVILGFLMSYTSDSGKQDD